MKPLYRCLIHIPLGFFNAMMMVESPNMGWAFMIFFMVYELNEDFHIKDQAWYDIKGWLVGFGVYFVAMRLWEMAFNG